MTSKKARRLIDKVYSRAQARQQRDVKIRCKTCRNSKVAEMFRNLVGEVLQDPAAALEAGVRVCDIYDEIVAKYPNYGPAGLGDRIRRTSTLGVLRGHFKNHEPELYKRWEEAGLDPRK